MINWIYHLKISFTSDKGNIRFAKLINFILPYILSCTCSSYILLIFFPKKTLHYLFKITFSPEWAMSSFECQFHNCLDIVGVSFHGIKWWIFIFFFKWHGIRVWKTDPEVGCNEIWNMTGNKHLICKLESYIPSFPWFLSVRIYLLACFLF